MAALFNYQVQDQMQIKAWSIISLPALTMHYLLNDKSHIHIRMQSVAKYGGQMW